jgi:hypothetical protein
MSLVYIPVRPLLSKREMASFENALEDGILNYWKNRTIFEIYISKPYQSHRKMGNKTVISRLLEVAIK